MSKRYFVLALFLSASPAIAQDVPTVVSAEDFAALRAELKALRDEVAALKSGQANEITQLKSAQAKIAAPIWKGAPQLEDKASGWSFKPRGRLHVDTGYVSTPGEFNVNQNLGTATRIRRLRIGIEGTVPGGFGYKAEVDTANANVAFGDVVLTYRKSPSSPFGVIVGNFELNTLEQIASSNFVSFTERSQMNEAFINARRLGIGLNFKTKDDVLRADVGLFSAHSIDNSIDNDGWIGATRIVYAPKIKGGFIHLGANFQHREFQSNNAGTASTSNLAPSTNQLARYRARPFTQLTDVRFVDTGSFAAKGDTLIGGEIAGIFGPLHFASEAQYVKVNAYRAGDIATGLNIFSSGNVAVVPTGNPNFLSAYGEVGYFFTGETRGYKDGIWGRTKVKAPLGKGGWGALQAVARVDWLDLNDEALQNGVSNNFTTGATSLATANVRLARGGTQIGYLLGVNCLPMDHLRFMLNYTHAAIQGGPFAAIVDPTSTAPIDQTKFGIDVIAVRAQVDF